MATSRLQTVLVVGSTTSTAYWVGERVVGLLLVTGVLARGPRHARTPVDETPDHDPVSVR